eukprot:m.58146 g.58146  ORF g.58146 m.58146 type:complete len:81 (-) comp7851_c4_seq1:947-1189(-)
MLTIPHKEEEVQCRCRKPMVNGIMVKETYLHPHTRRQGLGGCDSGDCDGFPSPSVFVVTVVLFDRQFDLFLYSPPPIHTV